MSDIDEKLRLIADEIDLTETEFLAVQSAYKKVGNWLSSPDSATQKYDLSSYLHTREEFRRVLNHSRIMTMPPYRVAISKAFREASAFLRICRFQG